MTISACDTAARKEENTIKCNISELSHFNSTRVETGH
jgi:hypothetical protein